MQITGHISRILVSALLLFLPQRPATADTPPGGIRTVVIDAGHGGHDGGAPSSDRKLWEKNINLDVSQRLAAKIRKAYPDVQVILTRDKDVFVPLAERGAIANRKEADLFISIHVNQAKDSRAHGFEVWCLGPDNGRNISEIVDFENESIALEKDPSAYGGFNPKDPATFIIASLQSDACLSESLRLASDMLQSMKQGPIQLSRGVKQSQKLVVLWKTTMPSILIEIGFISNSSDRSSLGSENGREQIAQRIFSGFSDYKKRYDKEVHASAGKSDHKVETTPAASEVCYGWQIFAGSTLLKTSDPAFLGYEPLIVSGTHIYKYIIGTAASVEEARSQQEKIRKKYPQSFLVKVEGDQIHRIR